MVSAHLRILTINDAAWLYAESFRTPMHVGALATFRLPGDAPADHLAGMVAWWRTVRTFSPPFNYLLRGPVPRWKQLEDDEIDLDHHFRHSAVPSPAASASSGCWSPNCTATRWTGPSRCGSATSSRASHRAGGRST